MHVALISCADAFKGVLEAYGLRQTNQLWLLKWLTYQLRAYTYVDESICITMFLRKTTGFLFDNANKGHF